MRPLTVAIGLLIACGQAAAAEAAPTVEELVTQILELRKQETAKRAELDALLKKQKEALDRLNNLPPGPLPPVPPKPPTPPADPLAVKIKAAFDGDGAPPEARKASAALLAELYRQAAKLAADPAVSSSGELLEQVRKASGTLVGAEALRECRKVVAGELAALLPTDEALSEDQRKAVAALFGKLAGILDSLGG